MTVRARTGRARYIAFIVESAAPVSRPQLLRTLQSAQRGRPSPLEVQLTIYEDNRGIVRIRHRDKEEAIALLRSLGGATEGFSVRTLKTSGTIRTLKERYFPAGTAEGQD